MHALLSLGWTLVSTHSTTVVFLCGRHPHSRDFNSTISVDVIWVKSDWFLWAPFGWGWHQGLDEGDLSFHGETDGRLLIVDENFDYTDTISQLSCNIIQNHNYCLFWSSLAFYPNLGLVSTVWFHVLIKFGDCCIVHLSFLGSLPSFISF